MRFAVFSRTRWRSGVTVVGLAGLLFAGVSAPAGATAASQSTAAPSNAATRFVADMQPGHNIGNTLDAIPTETSWGNPLINQVYLQKISLAEVDRTLEFFASALDGRSLEEDC